MKPDLPLAGQRALVTGASRGIGHAVAGRLALAGAEIVVHCHRERESAEALAAAWKGRGSRRSWHRSKVSRGCSSNWLGQAPGWIFSSTTQASGSRARSGTPLPRGCTNWWTST